MPCTTLEQFFSGTPARAKGSCEWSPTGIECGNINKPIELLSDGFGPVRVCLPAQETQQLVQ